VDAPALIELFNATVRRDPAPTAAMTVTRGGGVVRIADPKPFVLWWDFPARAMAAAVAAQAAFARESGLPVIWRVYDFDQPAGLNDCLELAGFESADAGTLMFLDLDAASAGAASLPDGVTISRVETLVDLEDFSQAASRGFGESRAGQGLAFANRLADPDFRLYLARADGEPIGTGRMETGWGGQFGYLFTGSVIPEWRSRGVYRALVGARMEDARRRGLRYLATEARDTSRPILEMLGFRPIGRQITWKFTPPASA
jgi:ribosomal protein S18 acetylase RimI-like enzyme